MSMMLKAIKAMNKQPFGKDCRIKVNAKHTPMNRAESKINCEKQLSTIVKMRIDGAAAIDIVNATGVSKSYVSSVMRQFNLVRPSLEGEYKQVRQLLMNAPDYTYKATCISKITGIARNRVSNILTNIPQAERRRKKGQTLYYKYNFNIELGSGSICCGAVY
jgi:hypothetical protein